MGLPIVRIGRAEYRVAKSPTVIETVGLGSCLAIILYDNTRHIGAMAHVMLPRRGDVLPTGRECLGKFSDSALEAMLKQMYRLGTTHPSIEAMIFGGADMFSEIENKNYLAIGQKNVEAVTVALKHKNIPLVAQETGGCEGRTVLFKVSSGAVVVRSVKGEERLYYTGDMSWPLAS